MFQGPFTALAFEGELRSRLSANYGADPIVAKIHELRLTIVEDVLGMDDGDGSGSPAIALMMQEPVPTATPKVTATVSTTSLEDDLTASPIPTDGLATATSRPEASETPTAVVGTAAHCDDISITDMWIHSDDEVRARVRNSSSKHAYLTTTVFEWPDVPEPAKVDWFRFDDKKYFSVDDWSSPTSSSGSSVRIKRGNSETWRVDFDSEPDEGIYGSFQVTLTFDVSGLATCTMSSSVFRDIPATPAPTVLPSETPFPTDTPGPTATPVPGPSDTPGPAPTDTPEPAPSDTPLPTPTDTPLPTNTNTPAPTATPG